GGGAAKPGVVARERVPRPDGCRIEGGVADEPGVGEAFAGAGLPGLARAADTRVASTGTAGDHALEHLGDLVGLSGGENPLALARARLVHLSAGEDHPVDRSGV